MKKFLAVYIGKEEPMAKWKQLSKEDQDEKMKKGIDAWYAWVTEHMNAIKDTGSPLGKTKKVDANGVTNIKNSMTGYTIIEAESHEAAAEIFRDHAHFAIFPGDSIEIMECLPIPKRQ